jgi:predicted nuclease with TOPRIM domain
MNGDLTPEQTKATLAYHQKEIAALTIQNNYLEDETKRLNQWNARLESRLDELVRRVAALEDADEQRQGD